LPDTEVLALVVLGSQNVEEGTSGAVPPKRASEKPGVERQGWVDLGPQRPTTCPASVQGAAHSAERVSQGRSKGKRQEGVDAGCRPLCMCVCACAFGGRGVENLPSLGKMCLDRWGHGKKCSLLGGFSAKPSGVGALEEGRVGWPRRFVILCTFGAESGHARSHTLS
jgi:hypothetical protein